MKAKTGFVLAIAVALAGFGGAYFVNQGDQAATAEIAPTAPASEERVKPPAAPHAMGGAAANGTGDAKAESIDVLAQRLKSRLEQNPDDMEGWLLLASSYHFLGSDGDALAAFAKARELGYTGETPEFVQQHAAGAHNAQSSGGQDNWLASYINSNVVDKHKSGAEQATAPPRLTLEVSVDKALVEKFPGETPVFIFARTEQQSGPPLAVVRKQLSELPLSLQLDDSNAMVPGHGISSVEKVVLCARISPTGNPMKQPGDIEAVSSALPVGQKEPVMLSLAL